VDHVKKSYSVGDISIASSSADFVDHHERITELSEDDEELDNRLIAEQYTREMDEIAAANSDLQQQPALNRGQILQCSCHCVFYPFSFLFQGNCWYRGWCDSTEAQLLGTAHCTNSHCVLVVCS